VRAWEYYPSRGETPARRRITPIDRNSRQVGSDARISAKTLGFVLKAVVPKSCGAKGLSRARKGIAMNRDEAAYLLGVSPEADPDAVRHAWRMWARIAHPDVGGDPAHFAQLDHARRILLLPVPAPIFVAVPKPRAGWSQVLQRPKHLAALVITGATTISLPALAGLVGVPFTVVVAVAALASAMWVAWCVREILNRNADRGHRIAALALCWLPIACAQVLVSLAVGASLVPVLPLLALPLVAVVATVNPGAGLWRPVGR